MSKNDEQNTETPYSVQALPRSMDRKHFACGKEQLDSYFHTHVGQDIDRGYGACFVAIHEETQKFAGYYTLSPCSVKVDQIPMGMARKLPRYDAVPCVLMGRLAVATAHQGQDLGEALLIDAWLRAKGNELGGYAMVVDAKDQKAQSFYLRYGFVQCPSEELKLFLSLRKGVGPSKQAPR